MIIDACMQYAIERLLYRLHSVSNGIIIIYYVVYLEIQVVILLRCFLVQQENQ